MILLYYDIIINILILYDYDIIMILLYCDIIINILILYMILLLRYYHDIIL